MTTGVIAIANEADLPEGQRYAPLFKLCTEAKDDIEAAHKVNPAVAEGILRLLHAVSVCLDALPTLVAIDQLVSLVVAVSGNAENHSAEQGDIFPAFPQQQFMELFMDELPRRHKVHIDNTAKQEAERKAQFAAFAAAFNIDPETGKPLTEEQIAAANEANAAAAAGQLPN